jgi:hypothetical protein
MQQKAAKLLMAMGLFNKKNPLIIHKRVNSRYDGSLFIVDVKIQIDKRSLLCERHAVLIKRIKSIVQKLCFFFAANTDIPNHKILE